MLRRARAATATASALVRNRVFAHKFANACARRGPVPDGAIGVYFATGPENTYQLLHWLLALERLAKTHPIVLIVARPDTGQRLLDATALPITFAPGSAFLETLVRDRGLRAVLYVNHVELNFRMLRFASPVHVYLGHGESDKDSSVSNQNKAYDRVFVAGRAAQDRMATHLRGFDVLDRTRSIGRPQLDHRYAGAPQWSRGEEIRVLYAPTWEGDRPSMAYGSLATHGVPMMRALADDPRFRIIYRPHPRSGFNSPAYRAADQEIRTILARHGDRHLVDDGDYGWQWDFADVCITDISSIAYDWLATAKPLLITHPDDPQAFVPPSRLLTEMPSIAASDATSIADRLCSMAGDGLSPAIRQAAADLADYYFGATADGQSTLRFHAAVNEVLVYGQTHPVA